MTVEKYVPPDFQSREFHCPRCGVYSHQSWLHVMLTDVSGNVASQFANDECAFAYCTHCKNYSIWCSQQMILPDGGSAPLPHPEMPDEVKGEFAEARSIVAKSPRGAAALLRLLIQKLMPILGEKGSNINDDIASLVKKGLPLRLKQAMDTVRVIGNDAVHPGEINLNDNPEVAQSLFSIVNMIIEKMIAETKELDALHSSLPPSKLKAIEKRDGAEGK